MNLTENTKNLGIPTYLRLVYSSQSYQPCIVGRCRRKKVLRKDKGYALRKTTSIKKSQACKSPYVATCRKRKARNTSNAEMSEGNGKAEPQARCCERKGWKMLKADGKEKHRKASVVAKKVEMDGNGEETIDISDSQEGNEGAHSGEVRSVATLFLIVIVMKGGDKRSCHLILFQEMPLVPLEKDFMDAVSTETDLVPYIMDD